MDLSDVVFNKDRKENFLRPDEEMERNMVSLEEALEVADKKSLRTLMLNVIRGDYRNSLAAINLALNSEDSETAHYAASVLQDVLNDFRSKVQTDYLLCQEENNLKSRNDRNTNAGPVTGHKSIITAFIHTLPIFSFLRI